MEKYLIIKQLGHGCFGYAYKVLNKNNKQIYVMKKIPKHQNNGEILEEMKNEAKLLASVNNEHIVKYYESFYSRNSFNIVMEFCNGTDLKTYIEKHKREHTNIPKEEIYSFILDICEGLKEIHSKNIIHKDIKPDNLFLTTNKKIKIGDFGISRQLHSSRDYARTCNGPINYMAPEEIRNPSYNTKVDIWALGCVIHELCTLNIWFKNSHNIINGIYGRIDKNFYGNFLQNLIDLLLSHDFHRRPQADEIIDIVRSKQIPNKFQRHNSDFNNFNRPIFSRHHDFNSNSRHNSNRIIHRTHTIQYNNSFVFNNSNRNSFIPLDIGSDENNEISPFFMENRPISYVPPSPIFSHTNIHDSHHLGHSMSSRFIPIKPTNFNFPTPHRVHEQPHFGPASVIHDPTRFGPPPFPFNANMRSPSSTDRNNNFSISFRSDRNNCFIF